MLRLRKQIWSGILIASLFCLIIIVFNSCRKETEIKQVDIGYKYFPLVAGNYIIYKVDSFYYNDFTFSIDTFNFDLKEKVTEIFKDNENRPTARIERFYRIDNTKEWTIKDVWYSNVTSSTAEKTEENQRFVKLIFPLTANAEWNGNRFNNLGSQEYKVTEINKPKLLNGISFDSTLTVLQMADSNLLEKKYAYEVYAKNVGLIYKRYIDIQDKDSVINFNVPLSERANSGVDYSYRIVEFGKE